MSNALFASHSIALSNMLAVQMQAQTGEFTEPITDNGVGSRDVFNLPTRGIASGDYAGVVGQMGTLAASQMRATSIQPAGVTRFQYTSLQEGGGGAASALSNVPTLATLIAAVRGPEKVSVMALGRIAGGANPVWAWASGGIDTTIPITRAGAGDITIARRAGWGGVAPTGVNAGRAIVIVKPSQAYAPSGLVTPSATILNDTQVQITSLQEQGGGAASILADADLDVAILDLGGKRSGGRSGGQVRAWGSVSGAALVSRSGSVAGVTNPGQGLYTITLIPDEGIGANESVVLMSPRGVLAPSGLQAMGYTRPDANTIAVTLGEEAGGGNASILQDYDYDFIVLSL